AGRRGTCTAAARDGRIGARGVRRGATRHGVIGVAHAARTSRCQSREARDERHRASKGKVQLRVHMIEIPASTFVVLGSSARWGELTEPNTTTLQKIIASAIHPTKPA